MVSLDLSVDLLECHLDLACSMPWMITLETADIYRFRLCFFEQAHDSSQDVRKGGLSRVEGQLKYLLNYHGINHRAKR